MGKNTTIFALLCTLCFAPAEAGKTLGVGGLLIGETRLDQFKKGHPKFKCFTLKAAGGYESSKCSLLSAAAADARYKTFFYGQLPASDINLSFIDKKLHQIVLYLDIGGDPKNPDMQHAQAVWTKAEELLRGELGKPQTPDSVLLDRNPRGERYVRLLEWKRRQGNVSALLPMIAQGSYMVVVTYDSDFYHRLIEQSNQGSAQFTSN